MTTPVADLDAGMLADMEKRYGDAMKRSVSRTLVAEERPEWSDVGVLLLHIKELGLRLSEAPRDCQACYEDGLTEGTDYAGRMRESLEWALALVSDWAPTQFYNMDDYRKAVAFLVPNPNPAGPPSDAAPSGATDGNEASPPQTGEASGPVGLGPTMADEQGDPRIGDTFLTRTCP